MPNFMQDILEAAAGEQIEAIVIGADDYDHRRAQSPELFGQVLPWDTAAPVLDYDYDDSYGGTDCHAITAWTDTRVLFVSCYDGATSVSTVPRHPFPHKPAMYGGG